MELNAANMRILTTGVQSVYQSAFNTNTPTVINGRIATPTTSATTEEMYAWLGQSTGFREWLGDRVIQNLALHDYRIKNRKFENTVSIKVDAISDDQYGVYNPMFQQLGKDSAEHPDILAFQLLENAGTALCYDGKPFFSASHPGVDGNRKKTAYSNDMGGTGPTWSLLCTRQILKPLILQKRRDYQFKAMVNFDNPEVFLKDEFTFGVDGRSNVGFGLWQTAVRSNQPFNSTTYAAARAQMMSFLRDNGQPWGFVPDLALVGPNTEGSALTVSKGELVIVNEGAAATTNVWKDTFEVLMSPRLTW